MQKRKLTVALLGLLFLTACKSNGDAVQLKFNLQKGKTYLYSMNMDMNTEAQGQKMDSKMAFDYSMKVLDAQDSVKTINSTFDRIAMNMNAGATHMNFDTNKPAADSAVDLQHNPMSVMSAMFNAMKGKSFQMNVTDKGEITKVTGLKEMADGMSNAMPDPNAKAAMQQVFQAQFNDENVKKSFGQALNIFPDKPVRVGDSWKKEMTMGGAVSAKSDATYTVKEIKADRMILSLASTISAGGANGQQNGTLDVDRTTGLVTDATIKQEFKGPVTMHNTVTIKGKEM